MAEAAPAVAVRVAGLSSVSTAGDRFYVLPDISVAKKIAEDRDRRLRETALVESRKPRTLEAVFEQMATSAIKELPIVLKADVQGSVGALRDEPREDRASGGPRPRDPRRRRRRQRQRRPARRRVECHHHWVPRRVRSGGPGPRQKKGVDIRIYQIIYQVTDDVRKALEGLLSPEKQERRLGECNVVQTFKISHVGTVAGCMVTDGIINRNSRLRVIREGVVAFEGSIDSLKRIKDDIREARAGQDCGIKIHGFNDVKVGDRLEAFETVEVQRKL